MLAEMLVDISEELLRAAASGRGRRRRRGRPGALVDWHVDFALGTGR